MKKQLRIDDNDSKIYPEINWDANVRRSTSLHHEEQRFIELRKHRISSRGTNSLHDFLGLPKDENVDPVDVPLIALGGSGGGYRAMYGFTGFISASKKLGLWDCLTWTAGVSGSCWTIAAYYTIASQSSTRLIQHYLAMGKEFTHPLSLPALTNVAGRRKGVYFLIGPLVRKVQSGIIGLGVMDIYATLTTAYQLISRSDPGAGLSRTTFQFSKVWTRTGLDRGIAPIPIFTAVRKSSKAFPTVTKNAESIISKVEPSPRSLKQHQTQLSETPSHVKSQNNSITTELREDQINRNPTSFPQSSFQWFEISPLEAGSSDAGGYVPTWSWGRSFMSGRSFGQPPEQSLSLFLGQCTSAPAGPLTGYISALLASLPQGTIMSRVLMALNEFVRMKRWEKTWGNPIRAGHDPNPFYGHNSMPQPPDSSPNEMVRSDKKWEAEGMIRLMDGGVSNNLPNHILARPERGAEIILTFDASSDVHKGSAIERIQDFANDCKLELEDENSLFQPPNPLFQDSVDSSAVQIERKFLHHYARVFQGRRSNGQELYLIYCPLLPSARNPGYDPSVGTSAKKLSRNSTNLKQDCIVLDFLQSGMDAAPDPVFACNFRSHCI